MMTDGHTRQISSHSTELLLELLLFSIFLFIFCYDKVL